MRCECGRELQVFVGTFDDNGEQVIVELCPYCDFKYTSDFSERIDAAKDIYDRINKSSPQFFARSILEQLDEEMEIFKNMPKGPILITTDEETLNKFKSLVGDKNE